MFQPADWAGWRNILVLGYGEVMWLYLACFQILDTCSVEADRRRSTKTPHLQVLKAAVTLPSSISGSFRGLDTKSLPFLFFVCFGADYFSLKSGSRPSSPGPSPAPSVAGSVTSSSGSARHRRPLISPARLNISGQKLRLFSTDQEPALMSPPMSPSHFLVEQSSSIYSGCFSRDISPFQSQNGKFSSSLMVKCSFIIETTPLYVLCHSWYHH